MPSPCIYCRRVDVPRTREHVLQAAFGAAATLPTEVCADCNSAFSPIDKSFVEAVRFYYTGDNMLRSLGVGKAVLDDGVAVNARYRADGNGEFLPQLYEATPSTWKFLGSREADFHAMLRELSGPASIKVKSEIASGAGAPRLSIVRSAPNMYLVQGVDSAVVEAFVSHLRVNGFKPDSWNESFAIGKHENPTIKFETALELEPFCRAMAKIAVNFVCYRLGPDTALLPRLDAVRRYARFGEGHFMDFAVPTLLNHELAEAMAGFGGPENHVCYLIRGGEGASHRESVFIAIRGKTIGRLDLTRGNPALSDGTWLLTRFDEAKRNLVDLTLPDDMLRAVVNPAAFGLESVWSGLK